MMTARQEAAKARPRRRPGRRAKVAGRPDRLGQLVLFLMHRCPSHLVMPVRGEHDRTRSAPEDKDNSAERFRQGKVKSQLEPPLMPIVRVFPPAASAGGLAGAGRPV
jgi:hypothetical protein